MKNMLSIEEFANEDRLMGEPVAVAWQIQEHDGEWTDIAPSKHTAKACLRDGTVKAIRPLYATHEEVERPRTALRALLAVAEMTTFSDQYPGECELARAALQQGGGE